MTKNEVDIIKNSVLDATEAYVDARLSTASFVKTQIGVVINAVKDDSTKKWVHTVRCNATKSNPSGIVYKNVLSINNIHFENNSVVFVIAPNAQFSNQFILGKLDDVPYEIVGGSIKIGRIGNTDKYYFNVDSSGNLDINDKFKVDNQGNVNINNNTFAITNTGQLTVNNCFRIGSDGAIYVGGVSTSAPFYVTNQGIVNISKGSINIGTNQFIVDSAGKVTCENIYANGGQIAGFVISSTTNTIKSATTNGNATFSEDHIACGYAGRGVVKMIGNVNTGNNAGCIQISGDANSTGYSNGIQIWNNGEVKSDHSWGTKYFANIPDHTFTYHSDGSVTWNP